MKKYILFLLGILLINLAFAQMPPVHYYQQNEIMKNPIDSVLYNKCNNDLKACYIGNELVDVGLVFYYTQRGKYSELHSSQFVRMLIENSENDIEYACAVGAMLHDSGSDMNSHNEMVTYCIKHSFLPNSVSHAFCEQHVDNYLESKIPNLKAETINALNDYQKCVPLFIRTMRGDPTYGDLSDSQIEQLFDKFVTEIQNSKTGYDTAFKTKSFFANINSIPVTILAIYSLFMIGFLLICILLILKIFKRQAKIRHYIGLIIFLPIVIIMGYIFIGNLYGSAFNNFINVISPVSNLFPIGDPEQWISQGISNGRQALSQGEIWLSGKDASGFTNLDLADKSIALYSYIFVFILAGLLIWFVWFLFKRNKVSGGIRL